MFNISLVLILILRSTIKIPFINKGMEFIGLHSFFKDNLVILSILNYFNDTETPIIFINITNQLGLLYLTLINL